MSESGLVGKERHTLSMMVYSVLAPIRALLVYGNIDAHPSDRCLQRLAAVGLRHSEASLRDLGEYKAKLSCGNVRFGI